MVRLVKILYNKQPKLILADYVERKLLKRFWVAHWIARRLDKLTWRTDKVKEPRSVNLRHKSWRRTILLRERLPLLIEHWTIVTTSNTHPPPLRSFVLLEAVGIRLGRTMSDWPVLIHVSCLAVTEAKKASIQIFSSPPPTRGQILSPTRSYKIRNS